MSSGGLETLSPRSGGRSSSGLKSARGLAASSSSSSANPPNPNSDTGGPGSPRPSREDGASSAEVADEMARAHAFRVGMLRQREACGGLDAGEAAAKRARPLDEPMYVVDAAWWGALMRSSGVGPVPPFDNSALVLSTSPSPSPSPAPGLPPVVRLRPRLVLGLDYVVVDEHTWVMLKSWYAGPGPEIKRFVRMDGSVELYPVRVRAFRVASASATNASRVAVAGRDQAPREMDVSSDARLTDVASRVRAEFALSGHDVAFHRFVGAGSPLDPVHETSASSPWRPLDLTSSPDARVGDVFDASDAQLALVVGVEETFARSPAAPPLALTLSASPASAWSGGASANSGDGRGSGRRDGLVGLANLGNTCFMNAALQCLSHTQPLTAQFLSGAFRDQINPSAKLGYRGEAPVAYHALLAELWSGKHASVSPHAFKAALDRWTTAFQGWRQHDSQELLSFVLDALHEDLSRPPLLVGDGPAHSAPAPPRSLVDRIFSGSTKSTVTCATCGFASSTPEDFRLLSLEVPHPPAPAPVPPSLTSPAPALSPSSLESVLVFTLDDDGAWREPRFRPASWFSDPVNADKTFTFGRVQSPAAHPAATFKTCEPFGSQLASLAARRMDGWTPCAFQREPGSSAFAPEIVLVHRVRSADGSAPRVVGYPVVLNGLPSHGATFAHVREIVRRRVGAAPSASYELRRALRDDAVADAGRPFPDDESDEIHVSTLMRMVCIVDWVKEPAGAPFLAVPSVPGAAPALAPPALTPTPTITPTPTPSSLAAKTPSVSDCLSAFTAPERLAGAEMWRCPKCDALREATKRIDVDRVPDVLVVHLKRFTPAGDKIMSDVVVPLMLADFVKSHRALYELYAVVRHHGASARAGHYDAVVRVSTADQSWRVFNDSTVSSGPVAAPTGKDSAGYVLFYRKHAAPSSAAAAAPAASGGKSSM